MTTSILQNRIHISYGDMSIGLDIGNVIGKGSFGEVRVGYGVCRQSKSNHGCFFNSLMTNNKKNTEQLKQYAVKCIAKSRSANPCEIDDTIKAEVKALQNCKGLPFVAQLEFELETEEHLLLGLQYCSGGDLFTLLSTVGLSLQDSIQYLAEIGLALFHLHKRNILYQDLKPENICLDLNGHVKLIDFGLAVILDETHYNPFDHRYETTSGCGTLEYSAPEKFLRVPAGLESDWWSYGVVAYELLTGELPFAIGGGPIAICNNICSSRPFNAHEYLQPNSPEHSFISMFLEKQPSERFGCDVSADFECLMRHELFGQIDWKRAINLELVFESFNSNPALH